MSSLYTLLAVILSWVLFRSPTISYALSYVGVMFGVHSSALWCGKTVFYLHQYFFYFMLCIIGIFPLKNLLRSRMEKHSTSRLCTLILDWGPKLLALFVLLLSYMKLAVGSFNPFIYFQF